MRMTKTTVAGLCAFAALIVLLSVGDMRRWAGYKPLACDPKQGMVLSEVLKACGKPRLMSVDTRPEAWNVREDIYEWRDGSVMQVHYNVQGLVTAVW